MSDVNELNKLKCPFDPSDYPNGSPKMGNFVWALTTLLKYNPSYRPTLRRTTWPADTYIQLTGYGPNAAINHFGAFGMPSVWNAEAEDFTACNWVNTASSYKNEELVPSTLVCPYDPNLYTGNQGDIAPVGSAPWALMQVFLGKGARLKTWDEGEYIVVPDRLSAVDTQSVIKKFNSSGKFTEWSDIDDLLLCNWELYSPNLSFNLTSGHSRYHDLHNLNENDLMYDWGYLSYLGAATVNKNSCGSLDIIEDNISSFAPLVSMFYFESADNTETSLSTDGIVSFSIRVFPAYMQEAVALLKKNFYVSVDGVRYDLGVATPIEGDPFYPEATVNYSGGDAQKLSAILKKQTGIPKTYWLNWI
ncbi:MAG: hypothetical protein LBI71_00155 [Enterobacteriaceae bacterium]|nr:hypothetical protein [Enterobacteriaceae bacterium]